jgi:hypothetical protein
MKKAPLVLMALNGLAWGGLVWMGFDGEKGVEARVGSVALGQVEYYVMIPLLMLTVSLIPSALLGQTKWSGWGNLWSAITLFLVFPYLALYSGGI